LPASKRGWVAGLTTALLPAGNLLGALAGAYLSPIVGWRGLFLIGLLPTVLVLMIRYWVPESPRWLLRMGRQAEARRSLAWALRVGPRQIELPAAAPEGEKTLWRKLFKYPRSMAAACLTGRAQTSGVGLLLWITTLFVPVLKISPAEASYLMLWVTSTGSLGRIVCSYLSDAIGRRWSGMLTCFGSALFMTPAGYFSAASIGGVSAFFLLVVAQRFFGDGAYAIIGPTWRRCGRHDSGRAAWALATAPAIWARSWGRSGWH